MCLSDCVLVGPQTQRLRLLSAFDYFMNYASCTSVCVSIRVFVCVYGSEPETAVFSDSDWYCFALPRLSPLHTRTVAHTNAHTHTHKLSYSDWYLSLSALYSPISHRPSEIWAWTSEHDEGQKPWVTLKNAVYLIKSRMWLSDCGTVFYRDIWEFLAQFTVQRLIDEEKKKQIFTSQWLKQGIFVHFFSP